MKNNIFNVLKIMVKSFTFWFIIIGFIVDFFILKDYNFRSNPLFSPIYNMLQLLKISETKWVNESFLSYQTTSPIYKMIPIIAFTTYGIMLDILKVIIKRISRKKKVSKS